MNRVAGQAEETVDTIRDPQSYYRWRTLLESESRALDFEKKWADSLRSVTPPERLGPAEEIHSDRWIRVFTERPDTGADVWPNIRDWNEFQDYIQAAVAVFESPLYEGRAASKKGRHGMGKSKAVDILARVASKRKNHDLSGALCEYRDRLARGEQIMAEADDWFQTQVVDRLSPDMREKYIQEMKNMLDRMQARLEAMRNEKDPEKMPGPKAIPALLENLKALETQLGVMGKGVVAPKPKKKRAPSKKKSPAKKRK